MNYEKLTLADSVYRIDTLNWQVVEMNIVAIIFIPKILGPGEVLSMEESVLQLHMANGTRVHSFSLHEGGLIIDDDTTYYFDRQEAEEDLIIYKTKNERESNMGMQDLSEEGEYGKKPEDQVVQRRNDSDDATRPER
jgi:hypothetical protein